MLLTRRLERAMEKIEKAPRQQPSSRSADECWQKLSSDAVRKAAWRERACLKAFFESHTWHAEDIAHIINELGFIEALFDTKSFAVLYTKRVRELMAKLERGHLGDGLGLFLHYEMHLPLDKILRIMQAASSASIERVIVIAQRCCCTTLTCQTTLSRWSASAPLPQSWRH
eukprot:6184803-Pleurochrysis_carterae.AAC.6